MRSHRTLAGICALVLLLTACGNRASDEEMARASGTGGNATATGDGGGGDATGGGSSDAGANRGPTFGTLKAPCGPEPDDGPQAASGPGITDSSIKIAVISDKAGAVKVPTASIEESVKAFVGWCNDLGGINGRQLELVTFDAKLFDADKAGQAACQSGAFAVVGSGAVFDDKLAQALADCDMPVVPAYAATAQMALAANAVQPVPNPTNRFALPAYRWIKKKFPNAVKSAGIAASDLPTATNQMERIVVGTETIGYRWKAEKRTPAVATSYTSEAADMKAKGVKYVSMVSAVQETAKFLRDMRAQDFKPEVVDLGAQYYDPEMLKEPGAEGAYITMNTIPFEEADDVPALKAYLDAYDKVDTTIKPTSLGVQAFSAGLLFATAAAKPKTLNRTTLFSALRAVHTWDGGGLHFVGDPGRNRNGGCFLYLQISDGKFVRRHPTKAGTFDCPKGDDNFVDVGYRWGRGAKKGG